ncbi:MAG: NAD(P)H-binding protein [Rubrobacteraceae bacterium]
MTEQDKILVIGATGNVGRHVVSGLRAAGASVRAFTRDLDSANLPDGVEVALGDLSVPDKLEAALEGVEALFLVWPFLTAEAAPSVLDVIGKHARRIVYLSSMGVRDDLERQAGPINQFHADMEQLIEQSGLEWTFVRSGGMATNTLGWVPQIREEGVVRWFHGDAARSLVHEADVAAVAVRALTENVHGGQKYSVTGPETLTQTEQARVIGEAIGRPVYWEEMSTETARKKLLAGMPDSVVDGILNAHAEFAEEPEAVTSTVQEITGVPARTFRQWATDHDSDFR